MSQEKLDILDKFRLRPSASDTADDDVLEEHRAYGVMRVGGRSVASLDVRFAGGRKRAFTYAYLMDVEFEPSSGIVLHFAAHSVTLAGSRLGALYDGLARHAVVYVQEQGKTETPDGADAVIEKIVIEPRER